jgi:hypothetical protein
VHEGVRKSGAAQGGGGVRQPREQAVGGGAFDRGEFGADRAPEQPGDPAGQRRRAPVDQPVGALGQPARERGLHVHPAADGGPHGRGVGVPAVDAGQMVEEHQPRLGTAGEHRGHERGVDIGGQPDRP